VKVLARVQNRYVQEIIGTIRPLYDGEAKNKVDPWLGILARFDPAAAGSELGVSVPQLTGACWFLVERGIKCDRARPGAAAPRPPPLRAQMDARHGPA
jgi:hypothetical protein